MSSSISYRTTGRKLYFYLSGNVLISHQTLFTFLHFFFFPSETQISYFQLCYLWVQFFLWLLNSTVESLYEFFLSIIVHFLLALSLEIRQRYKFWVFSGLFWANVSCPGHSCGFVDFLVYMTNLDSIFKSRDNFANKGPSSQGYGFSSGHVRMWALDCEESWALKNWCFWTVVLEKTLESPLDCKEIQLVHFKGNQSWVFFGRTDAKAETPVLWPPHAKRRP